MSKEFKNSIKIKVDQPVLELLIQTTLGCSRKNCPPHRGGWISRLFLVKYSPVPGFLIKNPYFHTDFQRKNHTGAEIPYFYVISLWIARKILQNSKWNSKLFAYVALTSSMGEDRIYLK